MPTHTHTHAHTHNTSTHTSHHIQMLICMDPEKKDTSEEGLLVATGLKLKKQNKTELKSHSCKLHVMEKPALKGLRASAWNCLPALCLGSEPALTKVLLKSYFKHRDWGFSPSNRRCTAIAPSTINQSRSILTSQESAFCTKLWELGPHLHKDRPISSKEWGFLSI